MKKRNLLSKAEMKKVLGGGVPVSQGCAGNDSLCPSGQSCCPVHDSWGNLGWGCTSPGMSELPGGGSEMQKCPFSL